MKKKDKELVSEFLYESIGFIVVTVDSLPSSHESLKLLQDTLASIEKLQARDKDDVFKTQVVSDMVIEAIQKHSDNLAYEGV